MLITLAASLKAGHSFRQGVQSVVEEGAEPAADEFKRVLTETQLGKPMDDALVNMAERVGSSNLTFVITAVTIQRQIGGSLAGLFDMIAETVRQRQQFARKVKSLTAMGRMSAYVLVGLPFFMAAVVTLMNPAYMSPLWHSGVGHTMVFAGLVMIGPRQPDAQEDRVGQGVTSVLLALAVLCLAGAAFAAAQVATYPARLKERSIRAPPSTAACASRRRQTNCSVSGSACSCRPRTRLAAIPLKLNPRTSVETIGTPPAPRPGSRSGSRPRRSWRSRAPG